MTAHLAALRHATGSETQRPIAVVVAGTISAVALTLVVLPATHHRALRLLEARTRRLAPSPTVA
jgi:Cu/Ag efflux pump CusA